MSISSLLGTIPKIVIPERKGHCGVAVKELRRKVMSIGDPI